MATKVAGEMYESITGQLFEIGRQLRQPNGYPFDPEKLKKHLQDAVEGKFGVASAGTEHIIDCDAMSGILADWKKEEHRKMGKVKLELRNGKLYVNGTEAIRYLSEKQKSGGVIEGNKLRKELANKSVLNACVLDYLLKHPELIPEEWKNGLTYFWGTIFRRPGGDLDVAYLGWHGGGWHWYYGWLGRDWRGREPAACLASSN